MKRKSIMTVLLLAVVLTACGSKEIKDEITDEVADVVSETEDDAHIVESSSVQDAVANEDTVADIVDKDTVDEDYIAAEDLSETEVLELYSTYMESEDYENAGGILYRWLSWYDSDKVQEKLDYMKEHVHVSGYTGTTYDTNDNMMYMSTHLFNEVGDVVEEQYITSDDTISSYSYQYIYDGDICTSQLCNDENGNVIFHWEAVYDKDGNITEETTTSDNGIVTDKIYHTYESGLCIEEREEYKSTYDGEHGQVVKLEYDEAGRIIRESYYDEDDVLFESVDYTYNENGLNDTVKYYSYDEGIDDSEPYLTYTYEFTDDGRVEKQSIVEGEHNEYTQYFYDKFGDNTAQKFYQHDELIMSTEYKYDFLGNIIIESIETGDSGNTTVYSHTYAFRE